MIKHFVARLLIALQIYGNIYQGAAHAADLADSDGIRNHIHLASFVDQNGSTRLALGTDAEDGALKILDSIEIPKFEQLIDPFKKSQLLDNGLPTITELDENDGNLSEGFESGFSTDDEDISDTQKPLIIQGLKIYIDHTGKMRVKGSQNLDQENHRKPIFLSSFAAIALDGVTANELILNAPQLSNYNKSLIGHLGLGSNESHFTNFGDMTIIKLAKTHVFELMVNHHVMTMDQGSVNARTFNNSGTFGLKQGSLMAENGTNTGWLKADSLEVGTDFTNEEDGVVITSLVSGAGELVNLGKIETLEDLSLDVKNFSNSAGGSVTAKSITGLTHLKKLTNAEDASIDAGQALVFADNTKVINQGGMQANAMTLYGGRTTNGSSGRIDSTTLNLIGKGEFENKGDIDVDQDLYLDLSGFTNKGGASLETGRIYGYEHLIILQNDSGSLFKVRDGPLALATTTKLINAGTIEAQNLQLSSDQTAILKSGIFRAPSISLTGVNPFTNSGQILANQKLELNLPEFTNLQRVESPSIDVSQVTKLTNAKKAVIDAQGSDLSFGKNAKVINDGNLKGRDYTFDGGSLAQGGRMDGRSLKLRDTAVTTTDEQIINLLGNLEESGFKSWAIRGEINAYHYRRYGNIDLYGILDLKDSFYGYGTIHPGGKLITDHASFYNDLFNHGQLIAKQSAIFAKGLTLTIAQSGFAFLHDLRTTGDITNHGKLQIVGIKPNQDVIKLTNSGTASIDANQAISLVKKDQPQNLARIDCGINLDKESETVLTFIDNECVKLNGDGSPDAFTHPFPPIAKNYPTQMYIDECVKFFNSTNTGRAFLKDTNWVRPLGIFELRALDPIQQYREWYEENYLTPLKEHGLVIKTLAKNWEEIFATNKPIKLQLNNQKSGKLALKSGKFELVGPKALINDGVLTQENSYIDWLVGQCNSEISGGTWQAKGSLGLLGCISKNVGKLLVEGDLLVLATGRSTFLDGLQALQGLEQAQARKVIVYADKIKNRLIALKPVNKTYPWPLEMHIKGNIYNSFEITTPELSIYARNLKTLANLFASVGSMHLEIEDTLDIDALIVSKKTMFVKAKRLKIEGMDAGTSEAPDWWPANRNAYGLKSHPRYDSRVLIKHLNGNGIYSESGMRLVIAELLENHYGTIHASYFTIEGKQLINTAGLICATAPKLKSLIKVANLENVRDPVDVQMLWCSFTGNDPCMGLPVLDGNERHGNGYITYKNGSWETSEEAVIVTNGNLEISYHTLKMLISSITSYNNLTLDANGVSLQNPGEGDKLPGTTTMIKRNHHINRIVGKAGIKADLGNANMATSMSGENIRVKAAWLTLQSLGLTPQQQIQIFDLFTECSNNKAYKNKNGNIDTVMPWKKSQDIKTIVVLGKMEGDKSIKVPISLEAIEQQTKNLSFRFNRGIDGIGSNINDFFNNVYVRNHTDTISQNIIITLGGRAYEIECLSNPNLTVQDVLKQGKRDAFAYLQLKYHENLNAVKAEDRVDSFLKMAMNSESQENRCIQARRKVDIDSQNDANIFTSVNGLRIRLSTNGNLIIGSDVMHYQPNGGGDYWQVLDRNTIKAVEDLWIQGKSVNFKAVNTSSGTTTTFLAKSHIIDEAVDISSKRSWGDEDGQHIHKTTRPQVSNHESGGNITSIAEGAQHLCATNFKCEVLRLTGLDGVDFYEVHNVDEYQHITQTEGDAIKKTVTTITKDQYANSMGGNLDVGYADITTNRDVNATNLNINGIVNINLKGPQSKFRINKGTNHSGHAVFKTSENAFWQKVVSEGSTHLTYVEPIVTGEYRIKTKDFKDLVTGLFEIAEVDEDKFDEDSINNGLGKKQVIIQQVQGHAISYMDRIKIDDGGEIVFENVHEKHEYYHEEHDGPTAIFAATVALAVTALTAGTATNLAGAVVASTSATCGATAAGVLGGMAAGAFTSLTVQTSMALLVSKGDIGKAAKILASQESFKNLVFSTVSGGIGGGLKACMPSLDLFDKFGANLVLNSANSGLRQAMFNEKVNFVSCLINAGLDTVAEIGANKIGDKFNKNKIDGVTSDILHFGLAASVQSINDLSLNNGFKLNNSLNAGFSSVIGHKVAKGLSSENDTVNRRNHLAGVSRVLPILISFLLNQSPEVASRAAQNAIDNNFNHDFVELQQANLVITEEDVQEGYQQLVKKPVNETLDAVKEKLDKVWDYTAMLEKRQGQTAYSMDGMDYPLASETLRAGTEIMIDQLKMPENHQLAGLYLTTIMPGASKVINTVVKKVGDVVKNTSKKILNNKTVKNFSDQIRHKSLNSKMSDFTMRPDQFSKIKAPSNSNSNFMNGLHGNQNRQMLSQNKANGTNGLGSRGFSQGKEPTLQNLANNYSSSNKPRVENVLTHRIDGSKIPDTQIGSKQVSQSVNKVVQKSEVERVSLDNQKNREYVLYKRELQREQTLRDQIFNVKKEELSDIKDLQNLGFKGSKPRKIERNNTTGRIQANTASNDSASYIYRQKVREFQNEIDIRGPSTTQRIKAPGPTLETVFEDGSRILLRAESKTGVAKVEITDVYRNIHEKITPLLENGGLK